jgi:hypothetical protein
MLCGRCLIEDKAELKGDLVICPQYDPKL